LISRSPSGGELGLRFRCRRWSCPSCAQLKKQEWLERLHQGITRHGLKRLYGWDGDAGTWSTVRKAIQRAGGKFIKVLTGAGRGQLMVLSTAPRAGAEILSPASSLEKLAKALQLVPLTIGQPVTCSERWLPAISKSRRWRYAGDIPASDQHFDDALKAQADASRLRATILEPGVAAAWQFSAELPEEEKSRIRERVFGHTLPIAAESRENHRAARRPPPSKRCN